MTQEQGLCADPPRALGRWHLGSLLALVADKLFALLSTSGAIRALARESFGCWAPLPEGSWCHPKTGMGVCAAVVGHCAITTLCDGAVPVPILLYAWDMVPQVPFPHRVKPCLIKPLPCPWVTVQG